MKKYILEMFGTFVLVLFGCGTTSLLCENCTSIISGLSFGFVYIFGYYSFNKVCPCFFNPALAFAALLDKRINAKEFWLIVLFEFIGAFLGGMQLFIIVSLTNNLDALNVGLFAVNGYGDLSKTFVSLWVAIFIEILLTFIFVFIYLFFSSFSKYKGYIGLILAVSYCFVVVIGFNITGGSANPARTFGPMFWVLFAGVTEAQTQFWIFILAPAIGSLLAYVLYIYTVKLLNKTNKNNKFLCKIKNSFVNKTKHRSKF